MRLYSEPGQGTTVRLYLPVYMGDASASTQSAAPSIARAPGRGRLLIVDDDPRVRRVSVRRLKELGYAVVEAESGPAALAVLDRGEQIDLLFTDVMMPGEMTGIELAHEARWRHPELRILFTSGYAESLVARHGMLTSNCGWLGKPYSISDLDAKLRELLAV